jgi:photosystem II stability/assembly factor-like uncharacterized protein
MSFVNEQTGWIVDNYGGILHTEDSGLNWTPQTSGTTWAITSVQFLDAQEGWATSVHREILHTTDGGNNWVIKSLGATSCAGDYNDIFFTNNSKGWIATSNWASAMRDPISPILRTPDAGKTWACYPIQTYKNEALQFIDDASGWVVGWNGILYTNNGGLTWNYQFEASSSLFVDICFVDQSHGWALASSGNIYKYQKL